MIMEKIIIPGKRKASYNLFIKRNIIFYGNMNSMGYLLFAKLVDSYIDYIIRQNPDDSRNAGFIGTDIDYK